MTIERRDSVGVSISVLHAVVRGSILYSDQACYKVKNLALNIRNCVSHEGRGSSVLGGSLRNLGKFV